MAGQLDDYIARNYRKALDYHYIQAFYQPVIRTISRKLCSFEALARWEDPVRGTIYPDEFIPVLEREQVIHHLDAGILRQVCARLRRSLGIGEFPVPVSVNLSRLDFTLCNIFTVVDGIVSEFQIPHDLICFEVTESIMAEHKEMMIDIVEKFRSAGYQIWMDDFGSAYSSLNVLKEFSFDELKLDMCFLRPFNQRSQRIATSVVEMAKGIDIHTLAEGVETEEQFRYFRNIGCEKVQGYYFGKPMPYEEAISHLSALGIEAEEPAERKYYDEIGKIDVLSAVPFMTSKDRDSILTARDLNSIPLALIEVGEDMFRLLYYNTAFEKTALGTGLFPEIFSQEQLRIPQPFDSISDKVLNLMDSTLLGGEGRMNFTSHEEYYEIVAKCVARTGKRYSVLLRMVNLTKASGSANMGHLDEFLRRIYSIFERITLVDLKTDTITPLYTATREQLVSGVRGVAALAREYAKRYIYPEDREAYMHMIDPGFTKPYFRNHGRSYITRVFRTSVRHGRYAWKAHTLLQLEEDVFLMLINNVHDMLTEHGIDILHSAEGARGAFPPERLWNNLIRSDLLRIFWKDTDRRFIGASKAFLDYYGFDSVDEILGKNDEDLGWHLQPDRYMNDEFSVIEEGRTTHNIPGFCINSGENKEILASKTPLYNENGEISGLMGYFIDRELLAVNDRRGKETSRRDILTGLLNSRGISEEAAAFRDAYYLRGVDFARVHIGIDDFASINEQYGYNFGDRILSELGKALKAAFGRNCAVSRYSGHKFVVLHQVGSREEVHDLRSQIKAVGASIREIDGIPVTLYLSVGFVLFSEYRSLEEQEKKADIRLLADHDSNISPENRMSRAMEMFHLFDNLPVSYSVYHVQKDEEGNASDAILFYANRKFEENGGRKTANILGHGVRELYPFAQEEWFSNILRAAYSAETVEGDMLFPETGQTYHYIANQIIYPGYCAVTYQEVNECRTAGDT